MMTEFLERLQGCSQKTETHTDFRLKLVGRICFCVQQFSPNRKWELDILIETMSLSSEDVNEELRAHVCHLLTMNPDIQAYGVQTIVEALPDKLDRAALVQVGLWVMGEFAEELMSHLSSAQVVDLLEAIRRTNFGQTWVGAGRQSPNSRLAQYMITCLIKCLNQVEPSEVSRIQDLISSFRGHPNDDVCQRAREYLNMSTEEFRPLRAILFERMPIPNPVLYTEEPVRVNACRSSQKKSNLLEFEDLLAM
jgi:AP-1 complex subunit gamma-1